MSLTALRYSATQHRWRSLTFGVRRCMSSSGVAQLSDIEPSRLEIVKSSNPRTPPPSSKLVFGHTFTDHMLAIPWSSESGWGPPRIQPYGPIPFVPGSSVLHYAQTVFEGLKAYRRENDTVTLFRPDMNMKRMNDGARRIALPTFNSDSLLYLIKQLVRIDKHWIPKEPGHSLYIRPTLVGMHPTIEVVAPNEALLYVICSPVGPYYPSGFKPVSLYGTSEYIRAAPGGTGSYKLGGNYAQGLMPHKLAHELGYVQNLWLHGPEHYLTEVGTMNLFMVFQTQSGEMELVTPPLGDLILPGITRDSILTLARNHASGKHRLAGLPEKIVVSERPVTMKEVREASHSGHLVELFGSGTAAVISPVDRIGYMGEDILIPTGHDGMGPVSRVLWTELVGRQTGAIPSEWSIDITD